MSDSSRSMHHTQHHTPNGMRTSQHRAFASMPRLGYDDTRTRPRFFRPPHRTLQFPQEETTSGAGGAAATPPRRSSRRMHAARMQWEPRHAVWPSDLAKLASAGDGAWMTRRLSTPDLQGTIRDSRSGAASCLGAEHGIYRHSLMQSDSGGARLFRTQRLRNSMDSRCPVSHPRLASNSAIPQNLKLLDLIETIAGSSSLCTATRMASGTAQQRMRANSLDLSPGALTLDGASQELGSSYADGTGEQMMDLADRLEERMRTTGQLVKVKTQAELEVLLPHAPKVLGKDTVGGPPADVLVAAQVRVESPSAVSNGGSSRSVSDVTRPPASAGERWKSSAAAPDSMGRGSLDGKLVPSEKGSTGGAVVEVLGEAGQLAQAIKDSTIEKAREKWIYVWDMHSRLYINRKMPGRFHHSSFVAGGAVKAAGSIIVEEGELQQLTTWSGHYRPKSSDIANFLEWLEAKQVNMKNVELLLVKPHKQPKVSKGR
jgi:hypothetical protein